MCAPAGARTRCAGGNAALPRSLRRPPCASRETAIRRSSTKAEHRGWYILESSVVTLYALCAHTHVCIAGRLCDIRVCIAGRLCDIHVVRAMLHLKNQPSQTILYQTRTHCWAPCSCTTLCRTELPALLRRAAWPTDATPHIARRQSAAAAADPHVAGRRAGVLQCAGRMPRTLYARPAPHSAMYATACRAPRGLRTVGRIALLRCAA
jgi:hypothetical protein